MHQHLTTIPPIKIAIFPENANFWCKNTCKKVHEFSAKNHTTRLSHLRVGLCVPMIKHCNNCINFKNCFLAVQVVPARTELHELCGTSITATNKSQNPPSPLVATIMNLHDTRARRVSWQQTTRASAK